MIRKDAEQRSTTITASGFVAPAVRHALNGASAFELMAWHGWKTIGEAQRYNEEANRIRLAESAGAKMRTGNPSTGVSKNRGKDQ